MNTLMYMLGTGLLKKEKASKELSKINNSKKDSRRNRAIEIFLREKLGNHLVQNETSRLYK